MNTQGEKRIRLKDIAKMAGVDLSLVSRVVNHNADGEISVAKRKKIEKIIRETNYVPSSAARSLVTRRTRQLMFIFSDNTLLGLGNEYFGKMLQGFSEACSRHKYNCLVNVLNCTDISNFILPENLKDYSVDGCVIAGFANQPLISHLDRSQQPVVLIEPSMFYENIPLVNRNDTRSTAGLLDYLRQKGYRRVWMSDGFFRPDLSRIRDLDIKKIPDYNEKVVEIADSLAAGIHSLPHAERPQLLICRGHVALHLLNKLKAYGLKCPEDVALLSTSDFEANQFASPSLSMCVQDSREIGRYAGDLLYRICVGKISKSAAVQEAFQHEFPVTITERESTTCNGDNFA